MLSGFRSIALPVSQLSLPAVLKCGQSFRWHEIPLQPSDAPESSSAPLTPLYEYRLTVNNRVICLRQTSDTLFYRALSANSSVTRLNVDHDEETFKWLRDYFQLDVDLVELYEEWSSRDPVFCRIRDRFEGIRILRQDPWENLISYITPACSYSDLLMFS
jgi:N-glycosylase/DNA lyase